MHFYVLFNMIKNNIFFIISYTRTSLLLYYHIPLAGEAFAILLCFVEKCLLFTKLSSLSLQLRTPNSEYWTTLMVSSGGWYRNRKVCIVELVTM